MMLSKLLTSHCRAGWRSLGIGPGVPLLGPWPPTRKPVKLTLVRYAGDYIPPSQYDIPISPKFFPIQVMTTNWELIPIFVVTGISILILVIAIFWASKNKVDVVFSTHSCANISRTMNLRKPTVHKIIIINQRYDPWPEMQDVLDKMTVAEHKALMRATKCGVKAGQGSPKDDAE